VSNKVKNHVIAQIWVFLLGGLGISYGLDIWAGHDFPFVLALSGFGSFISYIYSAPPLKLNKSWTVIRLPGLSTRKPKHILVKVLGSMLYSILLKIKE